MLIRHRTDKYYIFLKISLRTKKEEYMIYSFHSFITAKPDYNLLSSSLKKLKVACRKIDPKMMSRKLKHC